VLAGTALLAAPFAQTKGDVALLDAAFTAVSAVCVTGLSVVDAGTRFTPAGQAVVLGLIQVGGLGLMTYAVFASILLGRRIAFTDRMLIQETLHHSAAPGVRRLVKHILYFTIATEAAGALLLWLRFRTQFPAAEAVWQSVFHAVSAFCNAGFSLLPDNLVRYRGDWLVNLVIGGLVLVGGLGFLVAMEIEDALRARVRRQRPRLSLHAKLALAVSGLLLVGGVALFLALEWGNLLRGLPLGEKLLAACFQSVVPRTAGFNTLDYGRASTDTLFLTIFLMFVGASPGSTGGGIKTTTLGLLAALLVARWRGHGRATVFGRTIPHAVMDRALALTMITWGLTTVATFALVLVETRGVPFGDASPRFVALMFEVVSAFGTVGLSTGVTPYLSPPAKLILMLLMFVGRVGPLTLVMAIGSRTRAGRFRYAEENVMVG
jgi:trk system potassium uptake protein TrkH